MAPKLANPPLDELARLLPLIAEVLVALGQAIKSMEASVAAPQPPHEDPASSRVPASGEGRRAQIGPDVPPLLTQKQLCAWLQVSSAWVQERIDKDPDFPLIRVGRFRRFDADAIRTYLEGKTDDRRPVHLRGVPDVR